MEDRDADRLAGRGDADGDAGRSAAGRDAVLRGQHPGQAEHCHRREVGEAEPAGAGVGGAERRHPEPGRRHRDHQQRADTDRGRPGQRDQHRPGIPLRGPRQQHHRDGRGRERGHPAERRQDREQRGLAPAEERIRPQEILVRQDGEQQKNDHRRWLTVRAGGRCRLRRLHPGSAPSRYPERAVAGGDHARRAPDRAKQRGQHRAEGQPSQRLGEQARGDPAGAPGTVQPPPSERQQPRAGTRGGQDEQQPHRQVQRGGQRHARRREGGPGPGAEPQPGAA